MVYTNLYWNMYTLLALNSKLALLSFEKIQDMLIYYVTLKIFMLTESMKQMKILPWIQLVSKKWAAEKLLKVSGKKATVWRRYTIQCTQWSFKKRLQVDFRWWNVCISLYILFLQVASMILWNMIWHLQKLTRKG